MDNPIKAVATATEEIEKIKAARLNGGLQAIDATVIAASFSPSEQCGMLFLAHVLALRRLLQAYGIRDRGRRTKIIKAAVVEFEKKLRKHVHTDEQPAEPIGTE